jgi:hypothetical protein
VTFDTPGKKFGLWFEDLGYLEMSCRYGFRALTVRRWQRQRPKSNGLRPGYSRGALEAGSFALARRRR